MVGSRGWGENLAMAGATVVEQAKSVLSMLDAKDVIRIKIGSQKGQN